MLTKQENNMPFKTKKKKVSAVGRHVINYSENAVVSYSSGKQSFIHAEGNSNDLNLKISRTIEADYGFVKNELARISLLAAMIIGFQIALKLSHLSFLG